MKFEAGDDIVVLHTNEEGKIVEIINDKMVLIEVRGVRFPSYVDQIDFPYFKRFTGKKTANLQKKQKKFADTIPKEKSKRGAEVPEGMWLSLLPKFTFDEFGDEVVELFKIHMINRTEKSYKFIYEQEIKGDLQFELSNEIIAFQDFYLHDISFADFNDNPSLFFEFSLMTADKTKADFFETSLKLKGKQVFKRVEEMKRRNEPTIPYKLFDKYPDEMRHDKFSVAEAISNKYPFYDAKKARENLEPARSVIDLHIEKLSDTWQQLSNFEILTIQLKEFEKWYDLAIAHHLPSMVVIHGVGTGKLRDEIHEIIKTKNEVSFFINQYDPRYGYGATEIFLKH